jgi:WD40 repeat protein
LGTVRWREPLRDGSGFAQVAFSPDGKLVVSIGDVGLSIREAATGAPVTWCPLDGPMNAATFSPDGKSLFTAAKVVIDQRGGFPFKGKQRLQRLEVGTGRNQGEVEIERIPAHLGFCGFSPDGKLLLASEEDKKLRIWDAGSGKLVSEIDQQLTHWDPFSFSADGKTLAVVAHDGRLFLYEAATAKELRHIDFDDEDDSVIYGFYGPAVSPDGKTVVASTSKSLRIWDVETGKLRQELQDCRGLVAFTADGKLMACGDKKAIRLWDSTTLKEVRRFDDRHDTVRALAFSADGKQIVTGSEHSIGLWDVATGKQTNYVPSHHGVVCSLAFSADGSALATGGDDGTAIVWDLNTHRSRHEFPGHYIAAASLTFSPDGNFLATGDGHTSYATDSREAQIRIFDLKKGRLQRQFTGHLNGVVSLAFSPDGKRLASAGFDARARVWDPANGKWIWQVKGGDGCRTVAFSPNGESLLIGDTGGELALWRTEKEEKIQDLTLAGGHGAVTYSTFLKDGKSLVSLEFRKDRRPADGTPLEAAAQVVSWDAKSGREVSRVPLSGATGNSYYPCQAISRDGSLVAIGSDLRSTPAVLVWDGASGKLLATLEGHARDITSVAFSPDGKTLASGSRDTTVLLWDVPKAKLIGAWHLLGGDQPESEEAGKVFSAHSVEAVSFLRDQLRHAAALDAPYARLIKDLDDDEFTTREKASQQLKEAGLKAEFALRMALEANLSKEAARRIREVLESLSAARLETVTQLLLDLDGEKAPQAARKLREMGWTAESALRSLVEKSAPPMPMKGGREQAPSPRALWYADQALKQLNQPSNVSMPPRPKAAYRALAVLERIGTPTARQALAEAAQGPAESALAREAKAALDRLANREK